MLDTNGRSLRVALATADSLSIPFNLLTMCERLRHLLGATCAEFLLVVEKSVEWPFVRENTGARRSTAFV